MIFFSTNLTRRSQTTWKWAWTRKLRKSQKVSKLCMTDDNTMCTKRSPKIAWKLSMIYEATKGQQTAWKMKTHVYQPKSNKHYLKMSMIHKATNLTKKKINKLCLRYDNTICVHKGHQKLHESWAWFRKLKNSEKVKKLPESW